MNGIGLAIERIKVRTGLSYLEAIMYFCEENKIDIEDVYKNIPEAIIYEVKKNFIELNLVKDDIHSKKWTSQKKETSIVDLI